jgi:hypothetical protein
LTKKAKAKANQAQLKMTTTISTETTTYVFNPKMSIHLPRIDTRSLPSCPPMMNRAEVLKGFISESFHLKNIGKIERVDVLEKKSDEGWNYYTAFCHFDHWYDTDEAKQLQADIMDKSVKAKFHFHQKWFWIVNINAKPLTDEEARLNRIIYEREQTIAKQSLEIDDLKKQLDEKERAFLELQQTVLMFQQQMMASVVPLVPPAPQQQQAFQFPTQTQSPAAAFSSFHPVHPDATTRGGQKFVIAGGQGGRGRGRGRGRGGRGGQGRSERGRGDVSVSGSEAVVWCDGACASE